MKKVKQTENDELRAEYKRSDFTGPMVRGKYAKRMSESASSFGKTSDTSGFSTMTFDDSLIRFAYSPRTRGPVKSERLYSARNLIFPRFHGHRVKLGCHSLQLK